MRACASCSRAGERLGGTAADLLDGGFELPALLPFDREHVARGIDPPPVAVDHGKNDRRPPLVGCRAAAA